MCDAVLYYIVRVRIRSEYGTAQNRNNGNRTERKCTRTRKREKDDENRKNDAGRQKNEMI